MQQPPRINMGRTGNSHVSVVQGRTDSVSSTRSIVLMEVDQDEREESECEEISLVRESELSTEIKTLAQTAPEMIELEDSDDEEEIISLVPSTSQVKHIPVENQVVSQRELSPNESLPATAMVTVREAVMPSLEAYSDNLLVLPGQASAMDRKVFWVVESGIPNN